MRAYVVNRADVTWRVVDDEAVLVHAQTSEYFSLNESGTWLWGLLEAPCTAADLTAALGARYRRGAGDTAADVEAFLSRLEQAGLVTPVASSGTAAPPSTVAPRDPYEPPQLVKFGDLETLILSGE